MSANGGAADNDAVTAERGKSGDANTQRPASDSLSKQKKPSSPGSTQGLADARGLSLAAKPAFCRTVFTPKMPA